MRILVIGSGGRENVIVWKLSQSKHKPYIYCIPGNPGIAKYAECVSGDVMDIDELVKFAEDNEVDLTIVGPEVPLSLGIVDVFKLKGLNIFGPNKAASLLESSKVFAKNFMIFNDIPTAKFEVFKTLTEVFNFINNQKCKDWVVKADGLAAGKGVYVCHSEEKVIEAAREILVDKKFGSAGNRVIIEECLEGFEVSCMLFYDGYSMSLMPFAQDYKRLSSDPDAPNTGGMGSYAPHDLVSKSLEEKIVRQIIIPTCETLHELSLRYVGVLYIGLMIKDGEPYVLEYNVRFGDPEAQVVLPLLKTDFITVLNACIEHKLHTISFDWDNSNKCLCKIAVSEGYPGSYVKGREITGLGEYAGAQIFQAGTKLIDDKIVTDGGRVLGITVLNRDLTIASQVADRVLEKINFEGKIYRKDIGVN